MDWMLTDEEMHFGWGDEAVAQAQAKKLVEWGGNLCREHQTHIDPQMVKRFDCPECMAELHLKA